MKSGITIKTRRTAKEALNQIRQEQRNKATPMPYNRRLRITIAVCGITPWVLNEGPRMFGLTKEKIVEKVQPTNLSEDNEEQASK